MVSGLKGWRVFSVEDFRFDFRFRVRGLVGLGASG